MHSVSRMEFYHINWMGACQISWGATFPVDTGSPGHWLGIKGPLIPFPYTVKGNGGVTEHLSFWDPSNDKLAHGYKLQTQHKQQLVY